MVNNMETPGITFELQWKEKTGPVGCQEDVARIGLWDPDSTLDWQTFKSYVCQNLGTMDSISVAYIDSEGDELPIESECEFHEALKFAKHCASKGNNTILKVGREEDGGDSQQSIASKNSFKTKIKSSSSLDTSPLLHSNVKPQSSTGVFRTRVQSLNPSRISVTSKSSFKDAKNLKDIKDNGSKYSAEHVCKSVDAEFSEVTTQFQTIQLDTPEASEAPFWFKKYMQKMKSEIVTEVTYNVLHEIQSLLASKLDGCSYKSNSVPINKNKKKKKISDEDSSDGTLGYESRDHKLLKKLEKLHKREKKLEKKLDTKLEKLENKTKRMMEKKSQSKSREKIPEQKAHSCMKRRSGDLHVGTYLMDAILLNDYPKSEICVNPGEHFTKTWEILNAGTLPWTDKTELRQAWGTSGLEPEDYVVKCPVLQPGEQGTISVKFQAPEYPGTFESYWHFYHMGDRFGHWLGCAVVVRNTSVTTENETTDWEAGNGMDECNSNISVKGAGDSAAVFENDSNSSSTSVELMTAKDVSDKILQRASVKDSACESDLESDNLSVVTAPGTGSDSEEDKFVIIPMPACFVYDIPLETKDAVPVMVRQDEKNIKQEIKCEGVTSLKSEDMNLCASQDESTAENKVEEPMSAGNFKYAEPSQIIYAGDMSGSFIAVNINKRSSSNSSGISKFAVGSVPHAASSASVSVAVSTASTVTVTDTSEATATAQNNESTYSSKSQSTADSTNTTDSRYSYNSGACGSDTGTNSSKKSNSQDNKNQTQAATDSQQTNYQRSGLLGQDPINVIQILPETLVSGAVNVASSAINTACAVISNLRNRQSGDTSEQRWNSEAPSFRESALRNLSEMGFTDEALNMSLLTHYDQDINKVVAHLVELDTYNV